MKNAEQKERYERLGRLVEEHPICFPPSSSNLKNSSVVHDWVSLCTLKQQTVLISAIRGCDGVAKEDPSKLFTRRMRSTILKDADPRSQFMAGDAISLAAEKGGKSDIDEFLKKGLDPYPLHWFMHFLHAAEIVAYKHPDEKMRIYWMYFYRTAVEALHLYPESEEELDVRLADKCDK